MSTDMRKKIEVWGNSKTVNDLMETVYVPAKIKTIWAAVIPQTGNLMRQQVDTVLSNVTHKVITRYHSGKDITSSMYFMFKGRRMDIKFILNPYENNETLEIFCEEVME